MGQHASTNISDITEKPLSGEIQKKGRRQAPALEEFKMSGKSLVYESLYREQQLCDAVIRVHDAEFMVHKIIMCNCSSYFRALLTNWSTPHQRYFDMFDVAPEIMRLIIEFAYTDVLPITDHNVQNLFMAADFYDIKDMLQLCCRFMLENLSPQNCIGVMELTRLYHSPDLQRQAILFTLRHFEEVCTSSQEFLELSENHLSELIENNHLNVKQEKTVLEAILRWVTHQPEERQVHMPRLLAKVRLAFITTKQLGNIMMEYHVAQKNKDLILSMTTDQSNATSGSIQPLTHPRFPPAVLLAIGGWSGTGPTNSIEAYDVRTDRWVQVQSGMAPKAYHNTAFLNGSVYCLGGFDGRTYCNTMHRFDLATMTWHKMASMNSPRRYVSVTVLDNHIYAIGGFDGRDCLNTAERYSPEYNHWVEIALMQKERSNASSTTLHGKIYICGGFNGSERLSTAEVYEPQTDEWNLIADMSSRRSGIGVIAYKGKIFAVGGFDGVRRLETVEAYDPDTDTWCVMPPMLSPHIRFGIAVLDDRLYVTGGFNGSITVSKVECFDAETGVWSDVRNMTVHRHALSCSVVHGPPETIETLTPRTSPLTPEGVIMEMEG